MKISVIVPVYNIEDYLERCINSILKQTYTDFELILVDDGSTDRSGAICDEAGDHDKRVRVIHQPNGGSSAARNTALDVATGDYISFIDSDDYVEPDFLERLAAPVITAMEAHEYVPRIVQVGRDEIDESGNRLPDICKPSEKEEFIESEDFMRELLMHRGDCSFCTKITARELFQNRRFPVGKLNEDFHLLIQMLTECSGVMSLPGYGYHVFYRVGSNTRKKTKNEFSRVFKDNVDNADEVAKLVKEYYPDLMDVALRFGLFQRLDYMLHIPIAMMRQDYDGYPEVVGFIRKNLGKGLKSPYLTGKNKLYLLLFAAAPKTVRKVHAKLKGFD